MTNYPKSPLLNLFFQYIEIFDVWLVYRTETSHPTSKLCGTTPEWKYKKARQKTKNRSHHQLPWLLFLQKVKRIQKTRKTTSITKRATWWKKHHISPQHGTAYRRRWRLRTANCNEEWWRVAGLCFDQRQMPFFCEYWFLLVLTSSPCVLLCREDFWLNGSISNFNWF